MPNSQQNKPVLKPYKEKIGQAITETHDSIKKSSYTELPNIYFAFIDVLGFKKAFETNKGIKPNGRIAKIYEDVFNHYFALLSEARFMDTKETEKCYAGQTSDSLYFYTDRVDYLWEFIKIFTYLNVYAMSKNVFFRGGIAKGNIHYNKDYQFFGDSVIKAYLLESDISQIPVVVLDELTYKDIKKDYSTEHKKYISIEKNERNIIKPFAYITEKPTLDLKNSDIIKDIDKAEIATHLKENKSIFEYTREPFQKYSYLFNCFNDLEKGRNEDDE